MNRVKIVRAREDEFSVFFTNTTQPVGEKDGSFGNLPVKVAPVAKVVDGTVIAVVVRSPVTA